MAFADGFRRRQHSIEEMIDLGDQPVNPGRLAKITRKTLEIIDQVGRLQKVIRQATSRLEQWHKDNGRPNRAGVYELARTRVKISKLVRSLSLNSEVKTRLEREIRKELEEHQAARPAGGSFPAISTKQLQCTLEAIQRGEQQ